MLKPRTGTILNALVDEYIRGATPVASEDIARRTQLKVSPATIRNEMAELEEEGYIRRPHVSAGGIPADKGYRFYVESLLEPVDLPPALQNEIRSQFGRAQRDLEVWIQLAATVLSKLVDNMAIVSFPRATSSRLKYIQLVYLQDFLAMLILVFQEARLTQQLLPLDELTSQDELTKVVNKLNETVAGLTCSEIKARPMELTPLEGLVMDSAVSVMGEVDNEAMLDHYVDGLRLLLSQPEFQQTRRAQQIVEVLEERVLLKSILSEAPGHGGIGVFIGEENQEEALRPFSLVVTQYGIPEQASGAIGVIGPTRMEYNNVMSGMKFVSSFMSELVMQVHGSS